MRLMGDSGALVKEVLAINSLFMRTGLDINLLMRQALQDVRMGLRHIYLWLIVHVVGD